MGGSESSLALLHSIPDIEEAIKHSRTTAEEQSRHGWLPSLSSPKFDVSSDGLRALLKQADDDTHYRVTSNREYRDGVHFFQFRWKPGSQKRVAVGVCTKEMEQFEQKGDFVLGSDDQCAAWDLQTHKVYFNGCAIKDYPDKKPSSYQVPELFVMVLNMDQGSLSFRADNEDLGVVMSGLRHVATELLVVASLNTEGDSIEMKYLGGSATLKDSRSVDDNMNSTDAICFHKKCGRNIKLSEQNTKAVRDNPRKTFNGATVLTNRSLNDGESVKITVGEIDEMCNWTGSLVVGLTTTNPDDLKFPKDAMTDCGQGTTWAVRMQELKQNGKYVKDVVIDLDDVKAGDVVEIGEAGETCTITCNGKEVTSFSSAEHGTLFAFADVYGQTTAVSISAGKTGQPGSPKKDAILTVAKLFQMMENKKSKEIPSVLKGIEKHLNSPSYGINGKKLKKYAAEELAKSTAVKTMKSYMQFLIEKHPDNSKAAECYKTLIMVCRCYTDVNLQFAKRLGDESVLDFLMKHIKTMDSSIFDTKNSRDNLETVLMIFHNGAQAKENRKTFETMKFLHEAKKFVENPITNGIEAGMIAVLAMSYVHLPAEQKHLMINEDLAQHIVATLEKCISSPNHEYNWWSARKLVSGIANLAVHNPNASLLMQYKLLDQLVRMLEFYEAYDKECALNAIWSLINEDTNTSVFITDRLNDLLRALSEVADDSVKQAALRVLAKKTCGQAIGDDVLRTKCNYQAICERFKASLNLPKAYFLSTYDMCYCENCHAERGDTATFARGNPAKSYGVPVGWCRFGVQCTPRANAMNLFEEWHRAFHGTRVDRVKGILEVGGLAPAGSKVLGGENLKEQPGHYSDTWYKPEGFNTKRIFLSPSMRYSGQNVYASPSQFKDHITSKPYLAQVAFQVLVSPNSYSVEKETIGADKEIDPNFSNQEIEWVVEQVGAIELYGLLIKLSLSG